MVGDSKHLEGGKTISSSSPAHRNESATLSFCVRKITGSKVLAGSTALTNLLTYLVAKVVRLEHHEIKEQLLGTEVFARGKNFNPQADTIVRVHVRRLRHKLREYYKTQGSNDPIRIEIPRGSYVPIIVHHNMDEWYPTGLVRRRLAVLPFIVLDHSNTAKKFAKILARTLIDDLARSTRLEVVSHISSQIFHDHYRDRQRVSKCLNADAILEGGVKIYKSRLSTTLSLASAREKRTLWNFQFDTDICELLKTMEEITLRTVAPVIEFQLMIL